MVAVPTRTGEATTVKKLGRPPAHQASEAESPEQAWGKVREGPSCLPSCWAFPSLSSLPHRQLKESGVSEGGCFIGRSSPPSLIVSTDPTVAFYLHLGLALCSVVCGGLLLSVVQGQQVAVTFLSEKRALLWGLKRQSGGLQPPQHPLGVQKAWERSTGMYSSSPRSATAMAFGTLPQRLAEGLET